ncbi:hypothetical protein M8C21_015714 [Ambrosia artemisiifolia]|uniref:Uncharacterized protein n=1 Tax=Ambrosia artemisiifolia TaxID=4212 RepID=A0AAD5BXM3_AMBAR|nr:hypothetical protein M8C21_015714 [Ambrosia artemisiifolia]
MRSFGTILACGDSGCQHYRWKSMKHGRFKLSEIQPYFLRECLRLKDLYERSRRRLNLRADMRDDRIVWIKALHDVKGMFPRMSNSELMAPIGGITLSTEKLRQRLLEEGVSEAGIKNQGMVVSVGVDEVENNIFRRKTMTMWKLFTVLRSLIMQWCVNHNIEQPISLKNRRSKNTL